MTKQHSDESKDQSDTVVWRENYEMWREQRRGGRKSYEYFKRLTAVRLVRGISGDIGRVKRKGN
jgi:hypothetical protein